MIPAIYTCLPLDGHLVTHSMPSAISGGKHMNGIQVTHIPSVAVQCMASL